MNKKEAQLLLSVLINFLIIFVRSCLKALINKKQTFKIGETRKGKQVKINTLNTPWLDHKTTLVMHLV